MVNQKKKRCIAIVLAAGSGKRMKSNVAKQFMELHGKPLICHALNVMEKSSVIDSCVLVTGKDDIAFVKEEIVEKYQFLKVEAIVAGGSERYESVINALKYLREIESDSGILESGGEQFREFIFIHDGARPFVTDEMLERLYDNVNRYQACVAAIPSKDTIKISDEDGFAVETPERKYVWNIQTPQVFDKNLITDCYLQLEKCNQSKEKNNIFVTDDASVVELFSDIKVKLVEGSYQNLKITTPEDIKFAESIFLDF